MGGGGGCICCVHYIQGCGGEMRGLYIPCPQYRGVLGLTGWGSVYALSTIYRAVGSDERVCICYVHYIQGSGA